MKSQCEYEMVGFFNDCQDCSVRIYVCVVVVCNSSRHCFMEGHSSREKALGTTQRNALRPDLASRSCVVLDVSTCITTTCKLISKGKKQNFVSFTVK